MSNERPDYGCLNCGTINGEVVYEEDLERWKCECCGRQTIVTLAGAIDIIMDGGNKISTEYLPGEHF